MGLLVEWLLCEIQIATARPSQLFCVSAEDLGAPLIALSPGDATSL